MITDPDGFGADGSEPCGPLRLLVHGAARPRQPLGVVGASLLGGVGGTLSGETAAEPASDAPKEGGSDDDAEWQTWSGRAVDK